MGGGGGGGGEWGGRVVGELGGKLKMNYCICRSRIGANFGLVAFISSA